MCGIAGYFALKNSDKPEQNILEKLIVPLQHRGPDGYGFFRGKNSGLAHARLSIIDLSAGWQPLTNEDQSLWVVFNGEIFNYIELRQELIQQGHTFTTQSDTEIIVHLYEQKGYDFVDDLNGQFAIALYDRKKNELILARDRMGIRPLFYTINNGIFYFASEIKSLFNADKSLERKFNYAALGDIFTFWTQRLNDTAFDGIHQLPAGHWMRVNTEGYTNPTQYWEIPFSKENTSADSEEVLAEKLRELLIDSIRLRLRADVPVGAYLSGGLDSSAITALVKNYTNNPLKTFSVSFTDKVYDERDEQQKMVHHLDTDHHQVDCSYTDIADIFPKVIYHTEVPILRTAPSPLFLLSKLVRDNDYKVVLTGEGSDEILGGYDIFKEAKIRAFIHQRLTSSLRPQLLKRLYPYLALSPTKSAEYAQKFFETDSDPKDPFYAHRPRWKTTQWSHLFFSQQVKDCLLNPDRHLTDISAKFDHHSLFQRAQFFESKMLLGNYLLSSQGDRMAMANSIEGRYPFLDHRVVEFAGSIPVNLKMKVLNEKYILKRAVADLLPDSIVNRKKQPYMAPDILSFFGDHEPDYLDHYLSAEHIEYAGVFNKEAVKQLISKCRKRSRQGFRENMAFTGILSTMIIYDRFIRDFPYDHRKKEELTPVKIDIDESDLPTLY